MKTIYEPHPVSPERKAELRGQGFTIVDKAFEPAGEDVHSDSGKAVKAQSRSKE